MGEKTKTPTILPIMDAIQEIEERNSVQHLENDGSFVEVEPQAESPEIRISEYDKDAVMQIYNSQVSIDTRSTKSGDDVPDNYLMMSTDRLNIQEPFYPEVLANIRSLLDGPISDAVLVLLDRLKKEMGLNKIMTDSDASGSKDTEIKKFGSQARLSDSLDGRSALKFLAMVYDRLIKGACETIPI